MRVLVNGRGLAWRPRAGVGGYGVDLLRALLELDRDVEYVLLTTGRMRPSLDLPDLPNLRHVHRDIPNRALRALDAVGLAPSLERLAGIRPDVVLMPNLDFIRPKNAPYILTVHDLTWRLFPHLYSLRMRAWHAAARPERLISGASRVILPSRSAERDLACLFPKANGRSIVIPHGVSDAFSPRPEPTDHGLRSQLGLPDRFALFLGTIEPRKNVPALLDAMEAYRKATGDDLQLVLAGAAGWKSHSTMQRIERTSWARHIGYVDEADRPALLRAAVFLAWPSLYEGFGLPPLEAMASGLPVLASAVSSMPEVIGNAGLLVNPQDPASIQAGIKALARDESLRGLLRERGLARARRFSWDSTARSTLMALEEAVRS